MQEALSFIFNALFLILGLVLILTATPVLAFIIYKLLSSVIFSHRVENKIGLSNNVVFKIKIPSKNERQEDAVEAFLKSIHRLVPSGVVVSLEMYSVDQFMSFYIVVQREYKNVIESQIYAQFPDADLEETSDYLVGLENSIVAEMSFRRSSIYPLKTYKNLDEDLLKNVSAILSKTNSGEKVFIQLVLQRVGTNFLERGESAILTKLTGKNETDKLSENLFLGKVRIGYHASVSHIAKSNLKTVTNLFKGLKGENEIKITKVGGNLIRACKARMLNNGDLWSVSEAATVYHFPYKGNIVSNVISTTSKRAPAPDILPRENSIPKNEVSIFGQTNYRNEKRRFGIKRIDRRRHLYVVGKTGSGKSRLIELLLISDIQNGQGCCLLDPHGDLAKEILAYVPKERIKDVVYIDPSDKEFPIGFNPLEPVKDSEMRQHLATFFISIFKKQFAANWNERMEHIIRYITLALLETTDSNVLGIPRILSDTKYRQRVIKQIQDPVVKSFWVNEFSSWNERFSSDAVIPILNKVGQFVSNPVIRNMVGQRKNVLNFNDFMNEGKIVIINISKGKLGDENAAFLGSMFITKIQQAALARSKLKEEDRKDFYFYVDEFQNFATDAFSSILSEARKYRLNLTIAHQYIAQLPSDVKATAFGNVGSIISFAIGGDDAGYLSHEFSPTFTADDMINLNVREMYIKMSIDGKLTPPFSATTIDVPRSTTSYASEIKENSRVEYGSNKTAVENEILNWSNSANPIDSDGSSFPEPIV